MRKSVFTGLFACGLVFISSSAPVSAETIKLLQTNTDNQSVVAFMQKANETAKRVEKPSVRNKTIKHKIRKNETLSIIAKHYKTTWQRLYDKNKKLTDPNVINPGETISIPKKNEKLEKRTVVAVKTSNVLNKTHRSTQSSSNYAPNYESRGSSSGNTYTPGYCTWYAKNRRPDLPNNLGNAYTWVSRAAAQGLPTGSTPRVGAIGQQGNHVVYVERVNSNGTVTITDMNYSGRYVITTRTVPASYFRYIY